MTRRYRDLLYSRDVPEEEPLIIYISCYDSAQQEEWLLSASPITTAVEEKSHCVSATVRGPMGRTADRFYRPELDVLRFFAFLCVFSHHGLPAFDESHHRGASLLIIRGLGIIRESGAFGVCLFFVLSSYLITELLRQERARVGTVQPKRFYIRRVLRIWPLYFSFLFFAFALGTIDQSLHVGVTRISAFLLLAGNWYVVSAGCGADSIAPLWSISLEEQFYLAWPLIAKKGARTIVAVSIALFPIAWIMLAMLSVKGANPDTTIWVNSLVQFQFFGLGSLIALGLNGGTVRLVGFRRALLAAAGCLLWLIAQGVFRIKTRNPPPPSLFLILGYTLVAVGCACLLLSILGISQRFSPKLLFLGRISYGLYVFHRVAQIYASRLIMPGGIVSNTSGLPHKVAQLLSAQATAIALVLLLAIGSYHFLEKPFLRLKEHFAIIKSRAA